jgi:hypothetical protein
MFSVSNFLRITNHLPHKVVTVGEADNRGGVVLVLILYCNQKMFIDPVKTLLVIRHSAKEINYAHFILAHQELMELFGSVGCGTCLKVSVLGESWRSEKGERKCHPKDSTAKCYHLFIIGDS